MIEKWESGEVPQTYRGATLPGSDSASRNANDPTKAQNTAAATVAVAPTTTEEINAVVKPLESAVGATEKAGGFLVDAGETALGAVAFVLTAGVGKTADEAHDTVQPKSDSSGSPEPATAAGGAGARQGGGTITGFTRHGLNQAISRDGVGVSNRAMLDAMKNPKEVVPQSNGTTLYIGQNAVVLTNAQGKVVTTWATNSSGQR